MEKTFTYQFRTRDYDDEYEYTVKYDKLKTAIVDELFYTYFSDSEIKLFSTNQVCIIKKALKNLTDDNDNWEDLADDFESELKERFEDDAYEKYKDRGEM